MMPSTVAAQSDGLTAAQSARQAAILRAGRELAAKGGYEAVQMREVAANAGVALGTLYRYFPSKEHLLVGIMQRDVEAMAARVRTRPPRGATGQDRLLSVLSEATDRLVAQPRVASATIRALVSGAPGLASVVSEIRVETQEMVRGLLGDDVDVDEIGDLIEHIWLSAQVGWISGMLDADDIMGVVERAVDRLVPATTGESGETKAGGGQRSS